jgi:hypothetical protein
MHEKGGRARIKPKVPPLIANRILSMPKPRGNGGAEGLGLDREATNPDLCELSRVTFPSLINGSGSILTRNLNECVGALMFMLLRLSTISAPWVVPISEVNPLWLGLPMAQSPFHGAA